MNYNYTIHYEYFAEDEPKAWACFGLLGLLYRFKIGVVGADISQNHVGDITLTVNYSFRRTHQAPQ